MRPLRPPDAIVFDLDGTLVDTVGARISGWADTFAEAGIPVGEGHLATLIGIDGRRLAREVGERAGVTLDEDQAEELDRRAGQLFDEHNQDPRPLPGARELLSRLSAAGRTWVVATSSRAEQVAASIEALGLDAPPRIVDGSRVPNAKPAPDLLLLAAREAGEEPASCWYVGDSTWDMLAAVAARMPGIGVLAGAAVGRRALEEAGARAVYSRLDHVPVEF